MLVTVATFTEPWEAHLFRARLEAEGVFAVIAHEHHISVDWPYATALGGVKVQVPQTQLDEARTIKQRCERGDYQAELEAAFGSPAAPTCPRCGAGDFVSRPAWSWLATLLASVLSLGVIFPLRRTRHHCPACGARWQGEWRETDASR